MAKKLNTQVAMVPESPSPEKRRSSRRRRPVRGKTFQVNRMPRSFLKLLDLLEPYPEWEVKRPVTRADCEKMPRPCPFVTCRYHRYVDLHTGKRGNSFRLPFPTVLNPVDELDVDEFTDTCILDLAEEKEWTLEEVGSLLNLTRERVRQIEMEALEKLRENEELRTLFFKERK